MDINAIMNQAKEFQEKMNSIQADLATKQVVGSAGGGMVNATLNGKGEVLNLNIEAQLVRPEELEMLQDLIVAAVNDGIRKAADLGKSEMSKLTGGFKIPGLS